MEGFYCITPWCGLCRFPIENEASMKAIYPDGRVTESPFVLEAGFQYWDYILIGKFKTCLSPRCNHPEGQVTGCHEECYSIAGGFESSFHGNPPAFKIPDGHPGSVSNIAKYIPVTRFSYEPPASEQDRRSRVIQELMKRPMTVTTGAPEGSSSTLTADSERHYAIAEVSINQKGTSCRIDPRKAVWATYVGIDGVNYVSSLSNQSQPESHLLWGDAQSSDPLALYICEDYLGIRQVIARCEDARPASKEEGPAWWHTVLVVTQTLEFESDGLKLRKCCAPKVWPKVSWSVPLTPAELQSMDLFFWRPIEEETRMVHLDFNRPGTVGYFICWHGAQVCVRAHRTDCSNTTETVSYTRKEIVEMRQSFKEENCGLSDKRNRGMFQTSTCRSEIQPLRWTYHPLNPGELIEQVWIRGPTKCKLDTFGLLRMQRYASGLGLAMALVTNKGRTLIAGSFPPFVGGHTPRPSEWYCVSKVAETSKASNDYRLRIFLAPSMPLMAAPPVDGSDSASAPEPVQTSLGRPPKGFYHCDTVYYSAASLRDVAQVIACQPVRGGGKRWPILGLLFRYTNRNAASVGCFRPDRNMQLLKTDGSPGLLVGIDPKERQLVREVRTSAPKTSKERQNLKWSMLPWNGTLEWWFSPSGLETVVRYVSETAQPKSAEFWIETRQESPQRTPPG